MALTGLSRSLTWDDFSERDSAPDGSDESAFTKAVFPFTYDYETSGSSARITNVTMGISMDSSASWVVTDDESADLLEHEQGHYGITALGARDLYRQLSSLAAANVAALRAAANAAKTAIQSRIDAMNTRYDGTTDGTNHGQDRSAQQRWSGRIRSALADAAGTLGSL